MAFTLVIKEEAWLDMQEAFDYYELQQVDLGHSFLQEVESRLSDIESHPEYYSFIDSKRLLRDVSIDRFPYLVIYAIINNEVRVYAVHHTRKQTKSFTM